MYSEDSFLVYFQESSKHYASSLRTIFSCINCYFQIKKGINIKQFPCSVRFLKQITATLVPKQAKPSTKKEISFCLQSAPNDGSHFVMKLVVLFGIYGGMRLKELTYLLWSDIDEPQEGMLRIIIRGSKTGRTGRAYFSFVIPPITVSSEINVCDLFAKYKAQINPSDCDGKVMRTGT